MISSRLFSLVLGLALLSGPAVVHAAEQAPDSAGDPAEKTVLLMDMQANNVDQETVNTLTSVIAVELDEQPGIKAVAGDDLRRLLDLEAERQAAGCDSDVSCLAEIAGALGAPYLVTGQLGPLGSSWVLTLTLLDAQSAQVVNRVKLESAGIETIADEVPAGVGDLMAPLAAETSGPWGAMAPWAIVGSGAGVAALGTGALITGGLLYGVMELMLTDYDAVQKQETGTPEQALTANDNTVLSIALWNWVGVPLVWLGLAGVSLGCSIAAGGALWWVTADEE